MEFLLLSTTSYELLIIFNANSCGTFAELRSTAVIVIHGSM